MSIRELEITTTMGRGEDAEVAVTPTEWQSLEELAEQSGFSREQVSLLRWRMERPASSDQVVSGADGRPYTLLIGQPDLLELLLARWLGTEAAAAFHQAGNQPLVAGKMAQLAPPQGRGLPWPGYQTKKVASGTVIVTGCTGKLSQSLRVQLARFGWIDQALVVTRLGQPLNQRERAMLRSLVGLVATVRVLVVALPGEELGEAGGADLLAYAKAQALSNGFSFHQYTGMKIWYTDGVVRQGSIDDLQPLFQLSAADVVRGWRLMARQALQSLVDDLCSHAQQSADKAPALAVEQVHAAVDAEEVANLERELSDYLANWGRKVEEECVYRSSGGTGDVWTSEDVRAYALDLLHSWESHSGLEGMWVRYVQRLRPAAWQAILDSAKGALHLIETATVTKEVDDRSFEWTRRVPTMPSASHLMAQSALTETVMLVAKRAAVGLVIGVVAYLVVGALLAMRLGEDGEMINGFTRGLAGNAALVVGALLGYGLGQLIFPASMASVQGKGVSQSPGSSRTVQSAVVVKGWPQVAQRITSAFVEEMQQGVRSPLEICQALADRLKRG